MERRQREGRQGRALVNYSFLQDPIHVDTITLTLCFPWEALAYEGVVGPVFYCDGAGLNYKQY